MNTHSASLSLALPGTLQAAPEKPNVILIIADDQGYGDVSAHGNPVLETPHPGGSDSDHVSRTGL